MSDAENADKVTAAMLSKYLSMRDPSPEAQGFPSTLIESGDQEKLLELQVSLGLVLDSLPADVAAALRAHLLEGYTQSEAMRIGKVGHSRFSAGLEHVRARLKDYRR